MRQRVGYMGDNMITAEKWIKDNVDHLFKYALQYISDTQVIPTPKFHMLDSEGKMAIVSCDFWAETPDEEKVYSEFGTVLDKLAKSYGAIASLLVLSGQYEGKNIIGVITWGEAFPKFHYKEMIWHADILDFGPVVTIPWKKLSKKNLKF